jgi:hypothetical protein
MSTYNEAAVSNITDSQGQHVGFNPANTMPSVTSPVRLLPFPQGAPMSQPLPFDKTHNTGTPSDWDELCALTPNTECSGDSESLFWRLKKRKEPYRFRIVSRPVYFRQHWQAFKSLRKDDGKAIGSVISPAWDFKERDLDAAWAKGGYVPDKRYSCLVIDRDSGDLRILTAGPAVFLPIGDYQKERGILVYGDHAPDWMVRVRIVHGQTGEKTEYALEPLDSAPLTDEEKAKIAAFTAKVDLYKYFVKSTPEAIQTLYGRLDPSCKISPEL